uniref:Uncharacterized mitochondrial protein AtMg00810-like n=1 Tax=Nicotiana tabacum TaxID=4097 RepID=A0A1S4DS65_TOBAC|nr:PREDICTED: uncharacterized mitochondrial protein AtMg00810-like [Nicotiana tabacum]
MSTIKTVVAVVVKKYWPLFQFDVNNTFLYGDLDEEVFMRLPPGYSVTPLFSYGQLVCRLHKSLYGLRQASRQWYAMLSQALSSRGYHHSLNDYSLFTRVSRDSIVVLADYMDYIILTGTNSAEISSLKSFLDAQFKIKDLGSLSYFLGIEVLYSDSGVLLHQKKFGHYLLLEFHCSDIASVVCPLPLNAKLKAKEDTHLPKPEVYRSLVGNLNFLTNTRPDITFVVQHLSQFMQSPCLPHLEAALHLLKYLQGTADFGIFFNNSPNLFVAAYCDSDWVACPDTRKSVTRFCVLLGGSLVGWKSKKQLVVSISSVEAEYRAMSKVVGKLTCLHRLLLDLGVSCPYVPLFCDSHAAIHIAKNPVFHERTKHIELDCHLVRAKLVEGLIHLLHTSSSTQLTDIFTEDLVGAAHHDLLFKLGVFSPSNLKGGIGIT